MGRLVVVGVVAGVFTVIACVAVLRLLGAELSPPVVAGVGGAVAGAVVATVARRNPGK